MSRERKDVMFQRGTAALEDSVFRPYSVLLSIIGANLKPKTAWMIKTRLGFILLGQVFFFVTVTITAGKSWVQQHSAVYIHDSFSNLSYLMDTLTAVIESAFLLVNGQRLRELVDKFSREMGNMDKGRRGRHLYPTSRRLFVAGTISGVIQLGVMVSSVWFKGPGSVETFSSHYLWQDTVDPERKWIFEVLQDTYDITYICFVDIYFCTFLNYFILCAYACFETFRVFNEKVLKFYADRVALLDADLVSLMKAHRKMARMVSSVNEVTSAVTFAVVILMSAKITVSIRATSGNGTYWEVVDLVSIFFSSAYLLAFFLVCAGLNAEAHRLPEVLVACTQNERPKYSDKVYISATVLWTEFTANPIGLKASRYILLSYSFISMTFGTIITYSIILYEMAK